MSKVFGISEKVGDFKRWFTKNEMHWNAAFPEYFKNKYEIFKKSFLSFKS